ncbi:hypothetical protein OIU76_026726 [Salix suchowensis]|nr:hypothetical protein OIU76_026726 [Salix suchowensis]
MRNEVCGIWVTIEIAEYAVDHGPNSKHAFDWALIHLCRLADTIHLVHAVSSVHNTVVYETSQQLLERLAVEALQVAMVSTVARIVEGDAGKIICKEAERLKPAVVKCQPNSYNLVPVKKACLF